ncbi:MAG: glycosyl hydrolase family 28-related protein, partial [Opitutaceae bacterium]
MTLSLGARIGGFSLFPIFVLLLAAAAQPPDSPPHQGAGLIPADRLADWRPGVTVGVPGGIPMDRTHQIDVTQPPYGADRTGATDAQPAIMRAIAAAKDKGIVFLPAGTYRINTAITIGKSRITLRGAGPERTRLVTYNSGRGGAIDLNFLAMRNGFWGDTPRLAITGSPKRGATILSADPSGLARYPNGGVGQICQLALKNDPALPVLAPGGGDYLRKQVTRIVAKTATTITISPALLFDLPEALAPNLLPSDGQIELVGVEDLSIDATNSATRHSPLVMANSYACWVTNVAIRNVPNWHFLMLDSLQCEIRHCLLAKRTKPMGPDGGGLMFSGCAFFLVEDNVLLEAFPAIEVTGTCGSVFAYNYSDDRAVQGGILGAAINTNHGAHNSFNLYEGNYAPRLQSDGYHGSASHDTVFRNWLHGTSRFADQFWVCVNLNRFTRAYSIVGNVLGRRGSAWDYDNAGGSFGYERHLIYALGLPNMGNGGHTGKAQPSAGRPWADWGKTPGAGGFQELDLDVPATTLRKGNFNFHDQAVPATEALGAAQLPASLYRSGKPAWFGALAWPPFGPDVKFEPNKIPAQVRAEAGR